MAAATTDPTPAPPAPTRAARSVSWRALFLGSLLLPLNALWLVQMEMATSGTVRGTTSNGPYPSSLSLFANAICFLAALSAVNGLIRRWRPRLALSQSELLLIYIMLTIGTCLASIDFMDVLFPMLGHPVHYATASNGWQNLFIRYLPSWFYVRDAEALKGWYAGNANPYTWEHLRAWLVPVAAWSAFILVLLGVMLCLNTLLRVQWTRHEKLSYPIIEMPLDMTDPSGMFYRRPLMWAGFAVAGGISLVNGLAVLYPGVPSLPIKAQDISPFFPDRPWNAMGWTPIAFYPFAIGLGFLLPADMLFSCWFFALMWRAERVISSLYGWSDYSPSFPYVNEQSFGAYMGVAALALWGARRHLASVWRTALGNRGGEGTRGRGGDGRVAGRKSQVASEDPQDSALSHDSRLTTHDCRTYRLALLGAVGGTGLLMGFFHLAGLPLWMCVAAILIYLAIALACTRMRAELGPPAHDLHNGGPDYILTAVFGTRMFSPQTLTTLTWFWWFNRAYRSMAMPYQLEAFKMGERRSLSMRGIVLALLLASVVGLLSGCWALYALPYHYGAEVRMAGHFPYFGWEAFNRLSSWLQSPRDTDAPAVLAIGTGLCAALLLHIGRMRFAGWPFHPLGLAISGSFSMSTLWLPMLIAWVCKVSVLRYGGLRLYRRAMPFFLGLMLGDYLFGCLWPFIGWLLGVNTYSYYF